MRKSSFFLILIIVHKSSPGTQEKVKSLHPHIREKARENRKNCLISEKVTVNEAHKRKNQIKNKGK